MVSDGTRVKANNTFRYAIWSAMYLVLRKLRVDHMGSVWDPLEPGSKQGYVIALKELLLVGTMRPKLPPR